MNWRLVVTLCQASLLARFFELYLLILWLCHILVFAVFQTF